MSAVEIIVKRFSPIIRSNVATRPAVIGVDVAADER
jgi:hypothetical protein